MVAAHAYPSAGAPATSTGCGCCRIWKPWVCACSIVALATASAPAPAGTAWLTTLMLVAKPSATGPSRTSSERTAGTPVEGGRPACQPEGADTLNASLTADTAAALVVEGEVEGEVAVAADAEEDVEALPVADPPEPPHAAA